MRYFIYLSYDGTEYHGWQIQPDAISVQGEIQRCLSTILRRETLIVGAGRTDTGVHARYMAAHFDSDEQIDCQQLAFRLNLFYHQILQYMISHKCVMTCMPALVLHRVRIVIIYIPENLRLIGNIRLRHITHLILK